MRMLMLAMVLVLTACGGDGGSSGSAFDSTLPEFISAGCELEATCFGDDQAACEADVTADMADAKEALDEAGEDQCALCMLAKIEQGNAILEAACDVGAADPQAVYDACDLDAATDFDMDGTADNDDDEACAGYP